MRALLQKEWYLIQISIKSLLMVSVMFMGIDYLSSFANTSNISFSQMVPTILGMQIYTSVAYDDQSNFGNFALSLPLNKKTYLRSKYLTGMLLTLAGFILTVVYSIFTQLTLGKNISEYLLNSSLAAVSGLLLIAIALPLIYKFGVEKSRLWVMLALVILISLLAAVIGVLNFEQFVLNQSTLILIAGSITFGILLLLFISYRLSLNFFHFK